MLHAATLLSIRDAVLAIDPSWMLGALVVASTTIYIYVLEKWLLGAIPLPWAVPLNGWLPRISACIRSWCNSIPILKQGYAAHGSKSRPFVKPAFLLHTEVMVPREQIAWVLDQPQDVLSILEARYDRFALDLYSERDNAVDPVFLEVVRRRLARSLYKLQGDLMDEISQNVDAVLDAEPDAWTEVNVSKFASDATFSAMIRILVGSSLCRDTKFRKEVEGFVMHFGISAILIGSVLPTFLKPLLGKFLSCVTLWKRHQLLKWFVPLVESRFAEAAKAKTDSDTVYEPSEDLITWSCEALVRSNLVDRCNPDSLACRMALMIPAAVPTVQSMLTNVIYDIVSCPLELGLREVLYKEVAGALEKPSKSGWSDPALLPRLVALESTIRETFRCFPNTVMTSERKVLPRHGITLPSGEHLPRGTIIGIPTVGINADETLYKNAEHYDPFRYCTHRPDATDTDTQRTSKELRTSSTVVNINDTYLTFGAGKNACPGRWFAWHVIKLTVAYLLYNYEIEPLERRPLNTVFLTHSLPNSTAVIKVRRRKH